MPDTNASNLRAAIEQFLVREALEKSTPEFHGFLAGHIAGGASDPAPVLQDITLFLSADHLHDLQALQALYTRVQTLLEDPELTFTPLLPADDTALTERLSDISLWCQGFLTGFALNPQEGTLPDLVNETLNDYAAITDVGLSDDDPEEENEQDYLEIVEFVRLSAVSLFLEYHKTQGTEQNPAQHLFQSRNIH